MVSLKAMTGFLAGCMCVIAAGCGGGGSVKTSNDLKQIGLAYHSFCDQNPGKAPAKVEDLDKYLKTDAPTVYQQLKDGKYVLIWNVSIADMSKAGGAHSFVLGYEKDVPAKGGPVLFGDGSARQMTADEFKNARKADAAKSK